MLARTYTLTAIAAATLFATTVHAAPLSSNQILNQFNEVVLGSATSSSDTDGRAWIGGAVAGGTYVGHASQTPASDYAGLTVGGSASGVMVNGDGDVIFGSLSNSTINTGSSVIFGAVANSNLNGTAYVAGAAANTNFNGGHSALTGTLASSASAATSTNFGTQLGALSTSLSKLSSTGSSVTFNGNVATFNAVANSKGVAVFDLTGIDSTLFSSATTEFKFKLNGASTVIMNSDNKKITIGANFDDGSAQTVGSKVVWNFYDANTVTINKQFGGDVLATGAALTNTQNIEGGVFVNSLTQKGEIHLDPFTGNLAAVPEPEAYAMLLAGLGLVGFMARRRRSASRA
jgi:choice-of-anchor A domain-containing protein